LAGGPAGGDALLEGSTVAARPAPRGPVFGEQRGGQQGEQQHGRQAGHGKECSGGGKENQCPHCNSPVVRGRGKVSPRVRSRPTGLWRPVPFAGGRSILRQMLNRVSEKETPGRERAAEIDPERTQSRCPTRVFLIFPVMARPLREKNVS